MKGKVLTRCDFPAKILPGNWLGCGNTAFYRAKAADLGPYYLCRECAKQYDADMVEPIDPRLRVMQ